MLNNVQIIMYLFHILVITFAQQNTQIVQMKQCSQIFQHQVNININGYRKIIVHQIVALHITCLNIII